jgi:hypothetical protein
MAIADPHSGGDSPDPVARVQPMIRVTLASTSRCSTTVLPAVSLRQALGLDRDYLRALIRLLLTTPNVHGVSVAGFDLDRRCRWHVCRPRRPSTGIALGADGPLKPKGRRHGSRPRSVPMTRCPNRVATDDFSPTRRSNALDGKGEWMIDEPRSAGWR